MNYRLENAEIKGLLDHIANLADVVDSVDEDEPPCVFRSRVLPPVAWNEQELCSELKIELPMELRQLWMCASEVRIKMLEEGNCMGSGIYISSPIDVLDYHRDKISEDALEGYIDGDLVIGERIGDLMYLVVRCKHDEADFGTVLLSNPIDQRKDWQVVGGTITEFLANCLLGKV